jgi:signal transduction histidine kinase
MNNDLEQSLKNLKVRFAMAGLLLLFAIIGLSVIWNNSIKNELAQQATMYIRRNLNSGDSRGVLESLNGARLGSFENITHFSRDGQRIVTLPPTVGPVSYKDMSLWDQIIFAEAKTYLYLDDDNKMPLGSLSFVYYRFGLAHYAVGFWLFFMLFLSLPLVNARTKVRKEFQREIEIQNSKALQDVIRKVRHNIRSPLAVLGAFFGTPNDIPNLRDQGNRAVRRIEEILAEIECDNKKCGSKKQTQALVEISTLVEQIVDEKKLIAQGLQITLTMPSGPIYSTLAAMEFKATLSNILDNSLQAIAGSGKIEVHVQADGHLVSIEIIDNGHGIPTSIKSRVIEKGYTTKDGGSGLGLYYAQKLMDENQGHLTVESEVGQGTTISLCFPQKPTPSWHCGDLSLRNIQHVHIRDDQSTVLEVWKHKLAQTPVRLHYHRSGLSPVNAAGTSHLYLMDYDMGHGEKNGLQVISALGIASQSVLVTGHYDDPDVQTACATVGCKLLPKDQISSLRILNA